MRLYDLFLELRIGKNRVELEKFIRSDVRLSSVLRSASLNTASRPSYVFVADIGCSLSRPITTIQDIHKFYAWAEATGYWPQEELDRLLPYVAVDLAGG